MMASRLSSSQNRRSNRRERRAWRRANWLNRGAPAAPAPGPACSGARARAPPTVGKLGWRVAFGVALEVALRLVGPTVEQRRHCRLTENDRVSRAGPLRLLASGRRPFFRDRSAKASASLSAQASRSAGGAIGMMAPSKAAAAAERQCAREFAFVVQCRLSDAAILILAMERDLMEEGFRDGRVSDSSSV